MDVNPYADSAFAYKNAGWASPIPLGRRGKGPQKAPVPTGFTGWAAAVPSGPDIQAWTETHGDLNIGLRLPLGVYALDVDAHTKSGAQMAAVMLDLPETWTSTSRGQDSPSRHHLYAYDLADMDGRVWNDHPGDGLDSLHAGHRYVMAWPSVHPGTGDTVYWYDPTGELYEGIPAIPELAKLTRDQVHRLSKEGAVLEGTAAGDQETAELIEGFRRAPACPRVTKWLNGELDRIRENATALHDPGKLFVIVSYGLEGHAGVQEALVTHRDAYVAARMERRGESGSFAGADWWRMVRGAAGKKLVKTAGEIKMTCECDTTPKDEQIKEAIKNGEDPDAFTEAGLADRIAVDVLSGRYAWNKGLDWLEFNGVKWSESSDVTVRESVRKHVRAQIVAAARIEKDSLVKSWMGVTSAAKLSNITSLARGIVSVPAESLDSEKDHLNTPNGYLNLETGKVRPLAAGEYPTRATRGAFDPEARSDLWDGFLARVLPDREIREFLRRLIGYSMLGTVREHRLPILTGTGANGKGTFRDAIVNAFGDYALEVDPELVMERHNPRHGTFILELMGRRIVFTSETEKGRQFAESTMKRLTGGDPLQGNRMKKDPITFLPSHTLFMCTNHLPRVSGDDPAVWRRILVVPFNVVIPEAERDGTLPDRLMDQSVANAIVAWAHRGYLDYRLAGLGVPESVKGATARYQAENDHVGRFLAEQVETGASGSLAHESLNQAYVTWCRRENETPIARSELAQAMRARDYVETKPKNVLSWKGIRIRPELVAEFEDGTKIHH